MKPDSETVNIGDATYDNRRLKNHEDVAAFYRGGLSRKRMKELEEQDSPLLKEAKFLSKHNDLRQHMLIFQR